MESQSWVNQRGGIFILTASQMQEEGTTLIKSVAKVVIDVNADSLLGHLNKTKLQKASLPNFVSIRPKDEFISPIQVKRPENLVFDNELGGFTPDGKEYQIFLQEYPKLSKEQGQLTPSPWINVMANEKFGCLLTESGGGYTWSENSGENRLTPWTNDPISDPPGEVLYLRDELTGNIWSATPAPAGHGRDYLVRHGQGYSIFKSTNEGFDQQLKIFVDPEESIKYFELTLKNKTNLNRRLTTTLFAEWVLHSNREISKSSIIPEYDHENGTLFARNPYNEEFSKRVAFLSSDNPVHGFTTDRREFFGSPGQRRVPEGLQRIGLSGAIEPSVDACGALQNHLNFKPNQEHTIIYIIGQASNKEEATILAKTYSNADKLNQSWKQNQEKWNDLLGAIKVETPSDEMNLILNRWLLYQALSCRIWGRSAFYQSSGAFGFRDQLQDVISVIHSKPEISRKHILRAARHQFEAGDVLHWWHPPSGRGVRTKISDDLLWMVYATYEYVHKTGDYKILDEVIPFIKGDPLGQDEHEHYDHFETSDESASLFEHCKRALEFADTEGPHGLPLIGSGDWNDGMNRVGIKGKGESIWLGWFLVENHRRFAQLCKILELDDLADQHLMKANDLQETINRVAWDGNWYLRAYYDDGTPLGSHRNNECQIDSLPQSWGVLTGSAPKMKQEQALKAVKKHLVQEKEHLIKLFSPPFDETQKDPGYIKGYPPGIRENGGQYTHAAIWAVWALTHLGQGDEAFKQFSYLNPIDHAKDISSVNQYAVEPYVVAADIYSTQPFIGHGGWTWYTGSSGWLYRLGIEAILGFSLKGDHFTMEPCIPSDWDGFKFTYEKDRSTYIIEVENPNHVQKGVKKIILDGEVLEGNRIYFQNDQLEHQIRVSLG
jgi:cyclic beta-1,2-glucan synthetase